jgi:hypothetical protein
MSEFKVVEVVFKDENVLIKSLKDLGYDVNIHKEGKTLENGYSRSKPKAHIVVPKRCFQGMGDIGFERTKKGFVMHADDYDWGSHGHKFHLKKLNMTYSENKLKKVVNSTSRYSISSRKENKKGQIEIQLRVN